MEKEKNKQKRVLLCIDGGGSRGIIPATILAHLAEELRKQEAGKEEAGKEEAGKEEDKGIASRFDVMAGTSTGGIIVLGLRAGRTPGQLVQLFKEKACKIFDNPWWVWKDQSGWQTVNLALAAGVAIFVQGFLSYKYGKQLALEPKWRYCWFSVFAFLLFWNNRKWLVSAEGCRRIRRDLWIYVCTVAVFLFWDGVFPNDKDFMPLNALAAALPTIADPRCHWAEKIVFPGGAVLLHGFLSYYWDAVVKEFSSLTGISGVESLLLSEPQSWGYLAYGVVCNAFIVGGYWFQNKFSWFWRARYSRKGIDEVLEQEFKEAATDRKEKGPIPTRVLVPTYDLTNDTTVLIDTANQEEPNDISAFWKIAAKTSAAPTFFPPFRDEDIAFVDGGVFANNPSLWALQYLRSKEGDAVDDYFIINIGCGQMPAETDVKGHGALHWINRLIGIGTNSNNPLPLFADAIKKKRYIHLPGPSLTAVTASLPWYKQLLGCDAAGLDSWELVDDLEDATGKYIRSNAKEVQRAVDTLRQ